MQQRGFLVDIRTDTPEIMFDKLSRHPVTQSG